MVELIEIAKRLFWAAITAAIAAARGKHAVLWFILGFAFEWLAPIAVLLLPGGRRRPFTGTRRPDPSVRWRKRINVHCPHCGAQVEIDDIPGRWRCPSCGHLFVYQGRETESEAEEPLVPQVSLMIRMYAKLAKCDGVVTKDEVRQVDLIVRQAVRPTKSQRHRIMDLFNEARYSDEQFEDLARQLRLLTAGDREFLKNTLMTLFMVAGADGVLHPQQESLVRRAAEIFGLSDIYEQMRAAFTGTDGSADTQAEPDLDACYRLLGCGPDDSDERIKQQYRRKIKQNHPDRLIASGAGEEAIRAANAKIAAIKQAYEQIMTARS